MGGGSVKAVQAQLGHRSEQSTHKYAHLGSGAQRRLVEALKPTRAPHEPIACEAHVNLPSTEMREQSREEVHVNLASTDAREQSREEAHGNVASTEARGT